MNINKIIENDNNFFKLSDAKTSKSSVSFYSLIIGLKSFFETYHSCFFEYIDDYEEKDINNVAHNSKRYISNYISMVIHIQHFFELEIKRILEKEHPILSLDIKGDSILLYNIVTQNNNSNLNKLKSIEFSEALNRVKSLVNNGLIKDKAAQIIVRNERVLSICNTLRNQAVHRGKRIMEYCALDLMMSQNILPLVFELLQEPYYNDVNEYLSRLGIMDVINKLINLGKIKKSDYYKLALYKEIGRCKLEKDRWVDLEDDKLSDYVSSLVDMRFGEAIRINHSCLCCNRKALLMYRSFLEVYTDELGDDTDNGSGYMSISYPKYQDMIICGKCGFEINAEMLPDN